MQINLFENMTEKELNDKLKIVKFDNTDYKIEDPVFEQKFQKDFNDFLENLKKEKREKAEGGIFKQFYSDDFNLENPGLLNAVKRKEPWALKKARSLWIWNTKSISKSKFKTGNDLFDWYLDTVNLDWWLDQAIMLPFNLWNTVEYQIEKSKNKKENDKYIKKLQTISLNGDNLDALKNPKIFQQAAMELIGLKTDKKKLQERLAALFHVANRMAGKEKDVVSLRKDIIEHAVKKVDLLKSFEDNANYIFKLINDNEIDTPSKDILDLKNIVENNNNKNDKGETDWKKVALNNPKIYLNAVVFNKKLQKSYPYNNPEKFQKALDNIFEKFKDDPIQLKKAINAFHKKHKNIASVLKDKKDKEINYKPDDLIQRSDIEKAIYSSLDNKNQHKILSEISALKNTFNIKGNDIDEKNKVMFQYISDIMKNDLGIKNPLKIKDEFQLNKLFDKLKDMGQKLEKDFRNEIANNPNINQEEMKLLNHELNLKIQSISLIYNAFGRDDSWMKENDSDLKKELKEIEDGKKESLKKLFDFKKEFDFDLKVLNKFKKEELDFRDLNYARSYDDKDRQIYIKMLHVENKKIREKLSLISSPASKILDAEKEKQDNVLLEEILKTYKEIIDTAKTEGKNYKKFTSDTKLKFNEKEDLKEEIEELRITLIKDKIPEFQAKLDDVIEKNKLNKDLNKLSNSLGFKVNKGGLDLKKENEKIKLFKDNDQKEAAKKVINEQEKIKEKIEKKEDLDKQKEILNQRKDLLKKENELYKNKKNDENQFLKEENKELKNKIKELVWEIDEKTKNEKNKKNIQNIHNKPKRKNKMTIRIIQNSIKKYEQEEAEQKKDTPEFKQKNAQVLKNLLKKLEDELNNNNKEKEGI